LVRTEISSVKEHLATLIPATLAEVCQEGSRVDLVQNVVRPIADTFFACLLGMDVPVSSARDISVSQIFDRSLGLNRRKAISNRADEIRAGFATATNRLKTSPDYALALTIIGHDSIVASLGHSLLRVLHDGAGKRLCDIIFPALLPETGVPYTERLVDSDCSVGGIDMRAGDRIRLYFDDPRNLSEEQAAQARPFFGRGRHSCIGEEISIWIWQTITEKLSRFPLRCKVETARRRKRDYVFLYYSNIVVRFYA
jgi:cytochrome P450